MLMIFHGLEVLPPGLLIGVLQYQKCISQMLKPTYQFRVLNKTGVVSLPKTGFKNLVRPDIHTSKEVIFQQLNSMVLPKGSPLMVRGYVPFL